MTKLSSELCYSASKGSQGFEIQDGSKNTKLYQPAITVSKSTLPVVTISTLIYNLFSPLYHQVNIQTTAHTSPTLPLTCYYGDHNDITIMK